MDTFSIKTAAQTIQDSAVEAAVLELLNAWDENYLCGCGLDSFSDVE